MYTFAPVNTYADAKEAVKAVENDKKLYPHLKYIGEPCKTVKRVNGSLEYREALAIKVYHGLRMVGYF